MCVCVCVCGRCGGGGGRGEHGWRALHCGNNIIFLAVMVCDQPLNGDTCVVCSLKENYRHHIHLKRAHFKVSSAVDFVSGLFNDAYVNLIVFLIFVI